MLRTPNNNIPKIMINNVDVIDVKENRPSIMINNVDVNDIKYNFESTPPVPTDYVRNFILGFLDKIPDFDLRNTDYLNRFIHQYFFNHFKSSSVDQQNLYNFIFLCALNDDLRNEINCALQNNDVLLRRYASFCAYVESFSWTKLLLSNVPHPELPTASTLMNGVNDYQHKLSAYFFADTRSVMEVKSYTFDLRLIKTLPSNNINKLSVMYVDQLLLELNTVFVVPGKTFDKTFRYASAYGVSVNSGSSVNKEIVVIEDLAVKAAKFKQKIQAGEFPQYDTPAQIKNAFLNYASLEIKNISEVFKIQNKALPWLSGSSKETSVAINILKFRDNPAPAVSFSAKNSR